METDVPIEIDGQRNETVRYGIGCDATVVVVTEYRGRGAASVHLAIVYVGGVSLGEENEPARVCCVRERESEDTYMYIIATVQDTTFQEFRTS